MCLTLLTSVGQEVLRGTASSEFQVLCVFCVQHLCPEHVVWVVCQEVLHTHVCDQLRSEARQQQDSM